MNIYRVYPRFPVFNNEYFVAANDFGEAERIVMEKENNGERTCEGIARIEWDEPLNPDYQTRFIGVVGRS